MCEPTTIAAMTLALAAASAAAQVKAQQDQADAQNTSNERQRTQTLLTAANNNTQVNLSEQQTRDQAMQKIAENNRQAEIGIGKATASGGATGVEGNSVDALLGDLSGTQIRYNNSVKTNYDANIGALENQRLNVYANAASAINGLKIPVMPDYLSAGLKIGQAGLTYTNATTNPSPSPSNQFGSTKAAPLDFMPKAPDI